MIVAAMAAMDRVREGSALARWEFFALIGATTLAKGIGFSGPVLATATARQDRDPLGSRREDAPSPGVADRAALALMIALAWPSLVLMRYPDALGLWMTHVADRLLRAIPRISRARVRRNISSRRWSRRFRGRRSSWSGHGDRPGGRGWNRAGRTVCSGPGRWCRRSCEDGDGQERALFDPCPAPAVDLGPRWGSIGWESGCGICAGDGARRGSRRRRRFVRLARDRVGGRVPPDRTPAQPEGHRVRLLREAAAARCCWGSLWLSLRPRTADRWDKDHIRPHSARSPPIWRRGCFTWVDPRSGGWGSTI